MQFIRFMVRINLMWNHKSLIISLILLVAILLSYYFSYAELYWLPLTAWFVMQLPAGFLIRQVFQIIFTMVCCVFITALLAFNPNLYHTFIIIILICTAYLFLINNSMPSMTRNMLLLIPLTFIIAALHPDASLQTIKFRSLDILMG